MDIPYREGGRDILQKLYDAEPGTVVDSAVKNQKQKIQTYLIRWLEHHIKSICLFLTLDRHQILVAYR